MDIITFTDKNAINVYFLNQAHQENKSNITAAIGGNKVVVEVSFFSEDETI